MEKLGLTKKEIEIQRKRHLDMIEKIRKVKLAIFDVDGVLTDGKLYYGPEGEQIKVFNVKDGLAMHSLQQKKIQVAVISGRDSKALRIRMKELKVKYCYFGSKDKLIDYKNLRDKLKLTDEQILYVGDDLMDISVMNQVGISLAPADAHLMTQKAADAILSADGGEGIVQLVFDMFLMAESYQDNANLNTTESTTYLKDLKSIIH